MRDVMRTLDVQASDLADIYPDTDGKPIAENTLQFDWIALIKGGLDGLYAADGNVFVAGDLFWYPVEGRPDLVVAPDAMVVFGRPKGFRWSYKQWEEGGLGPQVVFEILSPRTRFSELTRKFEFYRRHGVEEYYIYNPGPGGNSFSAYVRRGDELIEADTGNGFVSPRLGVRFEINDLTDLRIIRPDGRPFMSFEELDEHAEREREGAQRERERAERAVREAEQLREQLRALGQNPG